MTRIVLHIGPEKCGSTSIQQAMARDGADHQFLLLDPYLVIGLDHEEPDPNVIAQLRRQIAALLTDAPGKTLIVSHEMVFKSQDMLREMAAICTAVSQDVRAVMYVRRPSDFAMSGFGQWHFRTPERVTQARRVLEDHGIDARVFSGVERHLLAGLLGGWTVFRQPSGHLYVNWHKSVAQAQKTLAAHQVMLHVGTLPRKGFDGDLIADFRQRAGLAPSDAPDLVQIRNPGFSPAVIEATVNAIEAGHAMPGPHEANDFYGSAGELALEPVLDDGFLTVLKAHVDVAFWEENQTFAKAFGHPAAYFAPDLDVSECSLDDSIIACEMRRGKAGRAGLALAAQQRADRLNAAWRARGSARYAQD
ncbi:MAG: hypothetical protein AAF382_17420 [Pseudomonadota bacterium]